MGEESDVEVVEVRLGVDAERAGDVVEAVERAVVQPERERRRAPPPPARRPCTLRFRSS